MQQMIGPDGQPVMMDPNMMQQPGQQYTEEQMAVSSWSPSIETVRCFTYTD